MAVKLYSVVSVSGNQHYVISRRKSDNYLVDKTSGQFTHPDVAVPFLQLAEHGIIKGVFERSEQTAVWSNCEVTNYYFFQTGLSEVPANDICVLEQDWAVVGDAVVEYLKVIAAALVGKTSGAGTVQIKFRDLQDSRDMITGIVDESGNRTIVTLGGE